MMGASLRNEPSLSSDSTTRKSLCPTRALEPPMVPTRPPTTTVGSSPAWLRMVAVMRGGGGLAVAAGHRDAVLQPHQLGQQLAARDHRNLQPARLLHFGILVVHGRADHQRPRAGHVGGGVAFVDARAQRGQPLGDGRQLQIGPADLVAEVQQHLGDAAHADPADAGEMQVLRTKKHFLIVLFRLQSAVNEINRISRPLPPESRPRAAPRPGARTAAPPAHALPERPPVRASSATTANSFSPFISASRTRRAAPPRSMASALRVWWSSAANGNGTRIDGLPGRRQLRNRARARAADHQVGRGERRRHVRDERHHLALQAGLREALAHLFERRRAGLMHDAHRQSRSCGTAASFAAPLGSACASPGCRR